MKNHELVVRIRDDERLVLLEKVITRGQKTFVEVGLALAEIRDMRLYKREYASFREYCQKKWGWTKQHAYRLIEAAPIAKGHQLVTSEGAARELAKAAPEQRAGVVQAVVDSGRPVTAKEIRRHLPPPPMQPSGGRGTGNPALPPPPPGQVLDATGWPIPTQLIPLWQRADEVQELLTILSRVKGALRSAQEKRDMLFAEVNFSSALSQLDQAWTDVKTAKPFAVCPSCQGQVPENCTLCRGRGLLSEYRWSTCVTREHKEFRAKGKKATTECGPHLPSRR
ncbi:MAG TPA: hypothetical protein P5205_09410 [Candidatus Paceibacterota bacterium]|nr:hypothetical protein [Verrucomicrobiota bacterium]HSA10574.1 hypothetical protein [Candidatus Paceibacterota bacterium]